MGESQAATSRLLGPRLGRLHAYRDRGGIYVDGLRTSAQAGILLGGVALGAGFTGSKTWAVAVGLAFFLLLEALKMTLGALDYRYKVMAAHQELIATHNPVTMRQVAALERLAPVTPSFHYPSPPCG